LAYQLLPFDYCRRRPQSSGHKGLHYLTKAFQDSRRAGVFAFPGRTITFPAPVSGGQFFPGTSEKDREHCHFSMISTKTLGEKVNILIVVRANSLRIVQIQF
jgi:hypothetical protein